MDGMIKCPACGENNSTELDYCQNCNTHLRPFDGGTNAAFSPGQLPDKKKNTAELEPILPQWLRDARQQSRETSQDDSASSLEPLKTQQPVHQPAPPVDLLAGLQSHADDDTEDETPDWLASITGVSNKTKKSAPEPSDVRRVEMGERKDFSPDTAPLKGIENNTSSWLEDIQAQPKSEKDELADWFSQASSPSANDSGWIDETPKSNNLASENNSAAALSDDAPDWLRQMQSDDAAAAKPPAQTGPAFTPNDDAPDWLKNMRGDDTAEAGTIQAGQPFDSGDDMPAWLQPAASEPPVVDNDAPTWLNTIETPDKSQPFDSAAFSGSTFGADDAGSSSTEDTPDWLKGMQSESPRPKETPLRKTSPLWLKDDNAADAADASVPAWLSPDAPVVNEIPPAEPKHEEAEFGDIPNWLKAAAPQSSIFSEPAVEPQKNFDSDAPDWLAAFKSVEGSQPSSPFASDVQDESNLTAPAFTDNSFEAAGDNSLFNEMPDWLSTATDAPAADPIAPAVNTADSLAAGELPSWVQAMRPVDTGSAQSPANYSSDQTLEARGALSGLQGVLPSVPGYGPSSKPKAYSILLQATEEQKAHALLLEQILSAEKEPQPIASYLPLAASRPLRWFIAFVVLAVVTIMSIPHTTPVFEVPSVPLDTDRLDVNQLSDALYVVQHIPNNAPVLVVMDYQPSRAAELEVAALPVFDQMDLLHHPNLYFVSTNEIGPMLTERMISLSSTTMKSLRDRYRESGQILINLGYLPGGEMGVRAFVKNPLFVMPLDMMGSPSPLQNGISINQFVAVIIITDNADSGSTWIEQTQIAKYPFPLVFIASAQVGPMLRPYYDSRQIKGIIEGLRDGAIVEKNDAKRYSTARNYWDAYSLGMVFTMILLTLGGLWNLALGARDRSAAKGAK